MMNSFKLILALIGMVYFTASVVQAKEEPTVKVDEKGMRVMSKTPPFGKHPRIFFTEKDLPAMRARMDGNFWAHYEILVKKIVAEVKRVWGPFAERDFRRDKPTNEELVNHVKPNEGRNIKWGMVSLYSVLTKDRELQKFMGKVINNHAEILLISKKRKVGGNVKGGTGYELGKNFNFWESDSFDVSVSWTIGGCGFPLSYDVLYNSLSPKQRKTIRKALAAATKGRKAHGMGFPKGQGISNHYGYHGDLAVMLAAIEGEEGYDKKTYQNICQVLEDYFEVGFTPEGACHEDAYGPDLGLRAGARGFMVMERRGKKLLSSQKFKNIIYNTAYEFPPQPDGEYVGGASGGPYSPYPTFAIVCRYMMPKDPVANYVFRHYFGDDYKRNFRWQGWLDMMIYGNDWKGDESRQQMLESGGIPLHFFSPRRGKLIARSDWSEKAMSFHFDARPDAFFIGHDKVERGTFMMSALGKTWVDHGNFRAFVKSQTASIVHIDGKAQAYKAPSVKFLEYSDDGFVAKGRADLKYAYDWEWSKPWPRKGDDKKFPSPWEKERSDPMDLGWPDKLDWMPSSLHGSDKIGYTGMYMWRKPFNEVERAFRDTALVRAKMPYALIRDDIKKDDNERKYEWYCQIASDVELDVEQPNMVILKERLGARRLMVKVLSPQNAEPYFESYKATYRKKSHPMKRLIFSKQAVEPRFRVLLLPYYDGGVLPKKISYDEATDTAKVDWGTDSETISFADGIEVKRSE